MVSDDGEMLFLNLKLKEIDLNFNYLLEHVKIISKFKK